MIENKHSSYKKFSFLSPFFQTFNTVSHPRSYYIYFFFCSFVIEARSSGFHKEKARGGINSRSSEENLHLDLFLV